MYPVLAEIGPLTISSFGLLLSLSLLFAVFIIWRLSKVYDMDSEKTLDIFFLTFLIGLLGSRIVHVLLNFSQFDQLEKFIYFNKYPGLSFWGGLLFGGLALIFFAKRGKLNFFLLADIACVGLFASLILGSLGCLLGSCQYGVVSSLPIAVNQVGFIGERFPVQLVAAFFYLIGFFYLWKACLRFHFVGKIVSLSLVFLGLIEFILLFLRADEQIIFKFVNFGHVFSLVTLFLGIALFYKQSKRSLTEDLMFALRVFYNSSTRQKTLLKIRKSWYNFRVSLRASLAGWRRKLPKKLNVKSNPTEFQ